MKLKVGDKVIKNPANKHLRHTKKYGIVTYIPQWMDYQWYGDEHMNYRSIRVRWTGNNMYAIVPVRNLVLYNPPLALKRGDLL